MDHLVHYLVSFFLLHSGLSAKHPALMAFNQQTRDYNKFEIEGFNV